MRKNELIKKLQEIEGDPIILVDDVNHGYTDLKEISFKLVHSQIEERNPHYPSYQPDDSFDNEFDIYRYIKEKNEAIVLSISEEYYDE